MRTEFSHRTCLFICGRMELPVSSQPKPRYRWSCVHGLESPPPPSCLLLCATLLRRLIRLLRLLVLLLSPPVFPFFVLARTPLYYLPRLLLPSHPPTPLNTRSNYPASRHRLILLSTLLLLARYSPLPILLQCYPRALGSTVLVLPSLAPIDVNHAELSDNSLTHLPLHQSPRWDSTQLD